MTFIFLIPIIFIYLYSWQKWVSVGDDGVEKGKAAYRASLSLLSPAHQGPAWWYRLVPGSGMRNFILYYDNTKEEK